MGFCALSAGTDELTELVQEHLNTIDDMLGDYKGHEGELQEAHRMPLEPRIEVANDVD